MGAPGVQATNKLSPLTKCPRCGGIDHCKHSKHYIEPICQGCARTLNSKSYYYKTKKNANH